jgi:hypothetical protein
MQDTNSFSKRPPHIYRYTERRDQKGGCTWWRSSEGEVAHTLEHEQKRAIALSCQVKRKPTLEEIERRMH